MNTGGWPDALPQDVDQQAEPISMSATSHGSPAWLSRMDAVSRRWRRRRICSRELSPRHQRHHGAAQGRTRHLPQNACAAWSWKARPSPSRQSSCTNFGITFHVARAVARTRIGFGYSCREASCRSFRRRGRRGGWRSTCHAGGSGTPIGPYDFLIVAQAPRSSATLVTANVSDLPGSKPSLVRLDRKNLHIAGGFGSHQPRPGGPGRRFQGHGLRREDHHAARRRDHAPAGQMGSQQQVIASFSPN